MPVENIRSGGALDGCHDSTGPASSSDPEDGVDVNNDGTDQGSSSELR
ncbi:MAG: hypothetical protein AB8G14_06980 [Ilumatobacter sp.]